MTKQIFQCKICSHGREIDLAQGEQRSLVCKKCGEIINILHASGGLVVSDLFEHAENPFLGVWMTDDDEYVVALFENGEKLIKCFFWQRLRSPVPLNPRTSFSFKKAKDMYVIIDKSLPCIPVKTEEVMVLSMEAVAAIVPSLVDPIRQINNTTVVQALMHYLAPIENKES